jgi:tryptophanyl-tRNA synthetase
MRTGALVWRSRASSDIRPSDETETGDKKIAKAMTDSLPVHTTAAVKPDAALGHPLGQLLAVSTDEHHIPQTDREECGRQVCRVSRQYQRRVIGAAGR